MCEKAKQAGLNIKVKTFTVKSSFLGLNLGVFHVNFSTELNPVWVNQKKSKSSYETQFINNLLPDFLRQVKSFLESKFQREQKLLCTAKIELSLT